MVLQQQQVICDVMQSLQPGKTAVPVLLTCDTLQLLLIILGSLAAVIRWTHKPNGQTA